MARVTRGKIRAALRDLQAEGVSAEMPRTCCRACAEADLKMRMGRKKRSWVLLPAFDGRQNAAIFDRAGLAKEDLVLSFRGDEQAICASLRRHGLEVFGAEFGERHVLVVRHRCRASTKSSVSRA